MYEKISSLSCDLTPDCLASLLECIPCTSVKTQKPLFFDIETTGFSRNRCSVYLIGAVYFEEGSGWQLRQWLALPDEEADLLEAFIRYAADFDLLISYNGDAFDLPFLKERAGMHGLAMPDFPSEDLYKALKPLSAFLKLSSLKQPMVEILLGFTDRKYPDGGDCIKTYKKLLKTSGGDDSLSQVLFGHNEEDLLGLLRIPSLLSFYPVREGRILSPSARQEDDCLLLGFSLEQPVPIRHSFGKEDFYLTLDGSSGRILLQNITDRLRLYYENIRDYYYIPSEDTALPRSLCSGIGREHRKPATRDTCYTYFRLNDAFFEDPIRQTRYMQSLLRHYLA